MTPERIDLKALKEAAEKATPGPWVGYAVEQLSATQFPSHWIWIHPPAHAVVDKGQMLLTPANGEYIASVSPERILALVAVVEAARAYLTRADMIWNPNIEPLRAALHPFTEST